MPKYILLPVNWNEAIFTSSIWLKKCIFSCATTSFLYLASWGVSTTSPLIWHRCSNVAISHIPYRISHVPYSIFRAACPVSRVPSPLSNPIPLSWPNNVHPPGKGETTVLGFIVIIIVVVGLLCFGFGFWGVRESQSRCLFCAIFTAAFGLHFFLLSCCHLNWGRETPPIVPATGRSCSFWFHFSGDHPASHFPSPELHWASIGAP